MGIQRKNEICPITGAIISLPKPRDRSKLRDICGRNLAGFLDREWTGSTATWRECEIKSLETLVDELSEHISKILE